MASLELPSRVRAAAAAAPPPPPAPPAAAPPAAEQPPAPPAAAPLTLEQLIGDGVGADDHAGKAALEEAVESRAFMQRRL
jgi:hypothetical protein